MTFWVGIFLVVTGRLLAGSVVALSGMVVTVLALRGADRAPEVHSGVRKLAGWLAGLAIGFLIFLFVVL